MGNGCIGNFPSGRKTDVAIKVRTVYPEIKRNCFDENVRKVISAMGVKETGSHWWQKRTLIVIKKNQDVQ